MVENGHFCIKYLLTDFEALICDHKPNKLTIVKCTSGNLFGDIMAVELKSSGSYVNDKSSFTLSLVNKQNRPLLFEYTPNNYNSICLNSCFGLLFGGGFDIYKPDFSNKNSISFSNSGHTYTHPEFPKGSDNAKTILSDTQYFKVQEIQVFQMQH